MRPAASIVIPVWNEWKHTRACLETLRPTLGVRDQVIVVDNGSEDETAAGLERYGWVQVVTLEQNQGFAAGCNAGASAATGDVIVYLNNDTLLPARWLDGLLAPFSDPTVGGTGPRSNCVSGPQLVEPVAYDATRVSDLQHFARRWREEHRGQVTETNRLVGFCLAVRRDLVDQLGGFDEAFGIGGCEDDDLCLRLIATGHRLLIAHESFVHHHGHKTFEGNAVDWFSLQTDNLELLQDKHSTPVRAAEEGPRLLSACMIVKDEEENLPSCLEALHGVVDEVVIYDTGSTDRTVQIARAAGALVVEGYWDDDFARARNASLEHCRGMWVLHVDADELITGDSAALRATLSQAVPGRDAFALSIDNLSGDGSVKVRHRGTRVFRRGTAHWTGRLHEQVVFDDGRDLTGTTCRDVILKHTGYADDVMERRGKVERNLRTAARDVEERGGASPALNLARALQSAGRLDEAWPYLERARALGGHRALRRNVLRVGSQVLLALGRSAAALDWIDELRHNTDSSSMPDYLEGVARLGLGQGDMALACMARFTAVSDEELDIPPGEVALQRGLALSASGDWANAAAPLAEAARERTSLLVWGPLLQAHARAGLPLSPVLELLQDADLTTVLGQCLLLGHESALEVAAALWATRPGALAVVAFVDGLAPEMSLEQAMDWSVRVREAGYPQYCPLVTLCRTQTLAPLTRLQACAVLDTGLADPLGQELLPEVAAATSASEFRSALLVLDELAPSLLPAFVTAAAQTSARSRAMADVLSDLGADEQAQALLAHAG